jgi:hypothetical protein
LYDYRFLVVVQHHYLGTTASGTLIIDTLDMHSLARKWKTERLKMNGKNMQFFSFLLFFFFSFFYSLFFFFFFLFCIYCFFFFLIGTVGYDASD